MVHFVLRVHGAGAGDDVVAPRQRLGPDELQQQPRHGPAVVPEDDVAVGQRLHRTFIKDDAFWRDGREQPQLLGGGDGLGQAGQHPGAQPLDIAAHFLKVGAAGLGPAAVQQQTSRRGDVPRRPGPQHGVAVEQLLYLVGVGGQLGGGDGVVQADDDLVGPGRVRLHNVGGRGVHDGGTLGQKDHAVQAVGVAGAVDALDGFALLLGFLRQLLHQRGFAAPGPAFDEVHLHPGLTPQRLKIALEPGGRGGPEEKIGGRVWSLRHKEHLAFALGYAKCECGDTKPLRRFAPAPLAGEPSIRPALQAERFNFNKYARRPRESYPAGPQNRQRPRACSGAGAAGRRGGRCP